MAKRGRPTKYQDTYPQIALDYLNECQNSNKIPWLEEVAVLLSVTEMTVWRWYKAKEEFCYAVDGIKQYQKLMLKKLGLAGNSTQMAIFLLKTAHGLSVPKADKYNNDNEKPLLIAFE